MAKETTFNDHSWVNSLFRIKAADLAVEDENLRYWSTADLKFTDTSMGGNLCINPLPQPCIFTDPPKEFAVSSRIGTDGMSPYYSEIFDDSQRIIYMRFGTMAFSPLANFIANAYSPELGDVANKGRVASFVYNIGKAIGFAISLIAWPLLAMSLLGKAVMFFMGKPMSSYAYLKPGMPNYLSAVQTTLNNIMVNLGVVFREAPGIKTEEGDSLGKASDEERRALAKAYPDLFPSLKSENTPYSVASVMQETMQIDVNAVANKAHRAAEQRLTMLKEMDKSSTGVITNIKEELNNIYKQSLSGRSGLTLGAYVTAYQKAEANAPKQGEDIGTPMDSALRSEYPEPEGGLTQAAKNFLEYAIVEAKDGAGFVGIRVESDDSVQETFSNNYKQSALAEKINSVSAAARDTMFNLSGGNISDNIAMQALGSVIGFATSAVKSVAEGLGVGGGTIVMGGGVIDIPKYWESSEANFAKGNYTVTLKARYGNRLCSVNDIYLPLAFLLTAGIPQATGPNSHTAPYYCMIFDKGRLQSRLAAISDMTVTRGGGNMGFNQDQNLMRVEVNFNIINMQERLAMPNAQRYSVTRTVAATLLAGPGGAAVDAVAQIANDGLFDDESPYNDYMANLASLGMWEQFYSSQRLKRRAAVKLLDVKHAYSPTRMAAHVGNSMPAQLASAFMWYREAR